MGAHCHQLQSITGRVFDYCNIESISNWVISHSLTCNWQDNKLVGGRPSVGNRRGIDEAVG